MSEEPSFSHNTLWRRLRRRYLLDRFSLVALLVFCPPAICSVSWLLHGPLWLTVGSGALWGVISTFMALFSTFTLTLMRRFSAPRLYPVPNPLSIAWSLTLSGGMLAALLMGRVDWAFYIAFGLSPLGGLGKIWPFSLRKALPPALAAALCITFAKHNVGMVVSLLLIDLLRQSFVRPTLREALECRSTRSEYVARIRDISAWGNKGDTESVLRAECDTEQWEKALNTLKQPRKRQIFRQKVLVWRARIYLGLEQYAEVLKLEGKARRDANPIEPYLAVAYARLGHREEAFRIAEEAKRLKRPGAEMAIGHLYFENREYETALQWYEVAAQNRAERPEALQSAGRALMALEDYREASNAYDQSIRLTKFVRPEDLLQLAKCLHQTHQEVAATEMEQLAHEKT